MKNIIRCSLGLWFMLWLGMSLGWAATGNYFSVSSTGTGATIDIELCLSAGTDQANSQANCETMTVANLNLAIQAINLQRCGQNNNGYFNAGLKILTSGYTVASGTTGYNQATGYYTFSVNCSSTSSVSLQLVNPGTVPTLTSIIPASGTAAGGTSFTLTGYNLLGTTSVTFSNQYQYR